MTLQPWELTFARAFGALLRAGLERRAALAGAIVAADEEHGELHPWRRLSLPCAP